MSIVPNGEQRSLAAARRSHLEFSWSEFSYGNRAQVSHKYILAIFLSISYVAGVKNRFEWLMPNNGV